MKKRPKILEAEVVRFFNNKEVSGFKKNMGFSGTLLLSSFAWSM